MQRVDTRRALWHDSKADQGARGRGAKNQ